MPGYGQFCPVAKAMEVLDERWTFLVIRELLMGSRHFNELRRGMPRISPALLSKRLRSLERHGIISRRQEGLRTVYELTQCGAELRDIVNGLGLWGLKWFPELGDADLDPHLLMWDMRRTIPVGEWPTGRTSVALRFTDRPSHSARWWVVVADREVDICSDDPGFPIAMTISTTLGTLTAIWRGHRSWAAALRAGLVAVEGPTQVRRRLPLWFGYSALAQAAGRPSTRALSSAG